MDYFVGFYKLVGAAGLEPANLPAVLRGALATRPRSVLTLLSHLIGLDKV